MLQKRVNLFGLWVDDITLERALALAEDSLLCGRTRSFFTPNLEMLERSRRDAEVRRILNSASVLLPDGRGVLLVAKLLGKSLSNTVAGIDFGEKLLGMAESKGARVFLLGGEKGVAELAKSKLLIKYPNLNICGTFHGYFSSDEAKGISRMIDASRADILIVCRGFPLQERFVYDMKEDLKQVKIFACLGGALDVWSGAVRRAPLCVREARMEWLWRISMDPKRAGRFIASLPVLLLALCEWLENLIRSAGMKRPTCAYNRISNEIEP